MTEEQKSIRKLWNEKDPRWLLGTIRGLAPDRYFTGLYEYIAVFARGELPDLRTAGFAGELHLHNTKLLGFLQEEAQKYHWVFDSNDNAYTEELIKQVREHLPHLDIPRSSSPQNLLCAVVVSVMRDLSLVEDLHRTDKINDEEHDFALREIGARMDRAGLNGLGKMLAARPELHEFLASDTRTMDARHIRPTSNVLKERTRAACYAQLASNQLDDRPDDALFEHDLEKVISKDFPQLVKDKNAQINFCSNVTPNEEPSAEERRIFAGKAILPSAEEMQSEQWREKASALTSLALGSGSETQKALALADFLLYDGIAANHPERETYAAKLRDRMGMEGEVVSESVEIARPEIEAGASGRPVAGEDVEDAVIVESPTGKEIEAAGAGKDDVADVEVVEEPAAPSAKSADNDQGSKAKKGDVVDAEIIEEKEEKAPEAAGEKKAGSGPKIATISAGATAVGLLMSAGSGKGTDGNSKEKDNHRALKFAAAAAALAVAAGGAILWSRKPEALYKPLSNLSLGGHGRG